MLAGHPDGRASLIDLRRAVAILICSGADWTERTKRLAARAPGLNIFSQSFVLREEAGWLITEAGRAFLAAVEMPPHPGAHQEEEALEDPVKPVPTRSVTLTKPLDRRRRQAGRRRPAAA